MQQEYEELLQSIQNKCQVLGFQSDPSNVITNFEIAIINAVGSTFGPHTKSKLLLSPDAEHVEEDSESGTYISVSEEPRCKTFLWHIGWFSIFANR